jgi:Kef-type K+ transport system membrane component KefB
MGSISIEMLLIVLPSVVVLSYLFSIISQYIKIPSVLLLVVAGILLRILSESKGWNIIFPERVVEFFGTIGLIMIVLEAGLDLKLGRNKLVLIRNSFFTILLFYKISDALKLRSFNGGILFFIILVTSLIMMLGILFYRKKEDIIVGAIFK